MKLIVKDIKKNFNDKVVLTGASYEFVPGKIYGLLGRNGAGKTTLFNIIYGEHDQDEGQIIVEEEGKQRDIEMDDISMVFAESILPDFLTGYEYIKFIFDIHKEERGLSIDDYFEMMDFTEKDRHRLIKGYSSGMKSKISIMGMYIQNPKIILLDEPLTAVDVISGEQIKKFIRNLKKDHIIILSTHMMELAKQMSDEIVLLNNGKLNSLENLMKDENFEENIINALRETENA